MPTKNIFLAMKESQFGRNLLNMLALKFQSTQHLDKLRELLGELEGQIRAQQNAEDNEFSLTSTAYTKTIEDQIRITADASGHIDTLNGQLADTRETLRQRREAKALLELERDQINAFLVTLAETRASESAAYDQRLKNTALLAAGVDRTSELFRSSVSNQELDQDAVANLVGLLANLRAALDASAADDTRAENQAVQQYHDFVANRNGRLAEIDSTVNELASDIARLEGEADQLETNLEAERTRKANAISLREQTEAALADLTNRYDTNKSVRTEQIRLLVLVSERLTTNPEEVQAHLQAA
jgi:chromosome segregation ATPase